MQPLFDLLIAATLLLVTALIQSSDWSESTARANRWASICGYARWP